MPQIVAVRLKPAEDGAHEHVDLLGYHSTHLKTEPVMVTAKRLRENAIVGEKYWVDVNGERAEITSGTCPVCGAQPYPRTSVDSGDVERLKELRQQ